MRASRLVVYLLLPSAILLMAVPGCGDLSGYSTGAGPAYRGRILGVEQPVLRRGFEPMTEMTLTFDPGLATSLRDPPGTITTSDGALTGVPLEPISPLAHDVLSEYEIPSGGRVRNYIFVLRPQDGPLAGREPFVFLSLMADGGIQVRIIVGGGQQAGDYFGVFPLTRPAT